MFKKHHVRAVKKFINKGLCFMWEHTYHVHYSYGDCGRKSWLCSACSDITHKKPLTGVVE